MDMMDLLEKKVANGEVGVLDLTPKHFFMYVHGSKESAEEAARNAGFSEEEITKHELMYAGYEIKIKVTPIEGGTFKEEVV